MVAGMMWGGGEMRRLWWFVGCDGLIGDGVIRSGVELVGGLLVVKVD